jgi:SagB-type dehydrogenase family enzyme
MTSGAAARRYHEETKHTYWSVRTSGHYLDWSNQPLPYKIYSTLEPVPLPAEVPPSHVPALDAIRGSAFVGARSADEAAVGGSALPQREQVPDLAAVARLCFFSNGVTRRRRYPGGELEFRAAACTGALYHVELYLVCGELSGLPAGVYHYGAHDHALRRLRAGDFRAALTEATGGEEATRRAALMVVATSTFWRNAWKYQARAYRHSFWDIGTILANLLSVAAALELPTRVVLGFADDVVNRLLGVDGRREATIALAAVGHSAHDPPPPPPVSSLSLPTVPLSAREVEYPAITAAHVASSLGSGEEAAGWRAPPPDPTFPAPTGTRASLRSLARVETPAERIETVIRRRGSSRRFAREPVSEAQLATLLELGREGIPADCVDGQGRPLSEFHLIVNSVDGLEPGTYLLREDGHALELRIPGRFRNMAGRLALGQDLAADAAVNVYFLADLDALLERFGDRGYRAAQLTSAIAAGKLYLGAYALRLGATGLTFFDDEVTDFLLPTGPGRGVMFLLATGRSARSRARA